MCGLSGAALLLLVVSGIAFAQPADSPSAPGEFLSAVPYEKYIDRTKVPEGRMFDVRDFGAVGDGKTVNTAAIARAVESANDAGGGVVRIDSGDYVSGTIHLKSNVTLYIAAGAVLRASRDDADYEPTHYVYCDGAQNVGIVGPGKILGEGDAWWNPPGSVAPRTPPPVYNLKEMEAQHFAAKRKKKPNRPSPLIRLRNSSGVTVENVVVENSPGWTLMFDHCDRVRVRHVVIDNNYHGENTDGIDIAGSEDVGVDTCFISTGDDGIVLKNGFAQELSRPMSNIRIMNCAIRSAANGIKIGTETWSDIRDVRVSDCEVFTDEIWPWGLAAIAIESVDGARVSDITVENMTVRNVNTALFIRLGNRNRWKDKDRAGALGPVTIRNVKASGVEFPCVISGIAGLRIRDVALEDVEIAYRDAGEQLDVANPVPEAEDQYPEFWMFGDLPSYGLYARHVDGLTIRRLNATPRTGNLRNKFVFDDVSRLSIAQ